MGVCVLPSVTLYLLDTMQNTVLVKLLSIFRGKLWMMRGGTLLILGHRVKGKGQVCHFVYKTLQA